jgi:hypothetical protein
MSGSNSTLHFISQKMNAIELVLKENANTDQLDKKIQKLNKTFGMLPTGWSFAKMVRYTIAGIQEDPRFGFPKQLRDKPEYLCKVVDFFVADVDKILAQIKLETKDLPLGGFTKDAMLMCENGKMIYPGVEQKAVLNGEKYNVYVHTLDAKETGIKDNLKCPFCDEPQQYSNRVLFVQIADEKQRADRTRAIPLLGLHMMREHHYMPFVQEWPLEVPKLRRLFGYKNFTALRQAHNKPDRTLLQATIASAS